MNVILIGDFNYDYITGSISIPGLFKDFLCLKQLIVSPTTDYGSCLDHIYIQT